ncbi:hypothetical protein ACFU99_16700 [Streptomyces sp. NPDC057654]|uniref:hypothetical protein n=1 Tax=Streptomyces sp. NPDC057654 TaxID=3346196 RepID=UPI0036CA7FC0
MPPEPMPLGAVLQALFGKYPADGADSGDEHRAVSQQSGQAPSLTGLAPNEDAVCRNSHADGNGQCAHCNGRSTDSRDTHEQG